MGYHTTSNNHPIVWCDDCGAVVEIASQMLHNMFHESLVRDFADKDHRHEGRR